MRKLGPEVKLTPEERTSLFEKVCSKQGSADEVMYIAWISGVNTRAQYEDYLQTCKDYAEL